MFDQAYFNKKKKSNINQQKLYLITYAIRND